jgi:hypothetical protein
MARPAGGGGVNVSIDASGSDRCRFHVKHCRSRIRRGFALTRTMFRWPMNEAASVLVLVELVNILKNMAASCARVNPLTLLFWTIFALLVRGSGVLRRRADAGRVAAGTFRFGIPVHRVCDLDAPGASSPETSALRLWPGSPGLASIRGAGTSITGKDTHRFSGHAVISGNVRT